LRLTRSEDRTWYEKELYSQLLGPGSPWQEAAPDVDLAGPGQAGPDGWNVDHYAEQTYFHPFVQRFLFGTGQGAACRHLVRKPDHAITTLSLTARYGGGPGLGRFVINLHVDRCVLTMVSNPGLAILTLEVSATTPEQMKRFSPEAFAGNGLTLADALSVHDVLRRIFPPFFVDPDAAKEKDPEKEKLREKDIVDTSLFPINVQLKRTGIEPIPVQPHRQLYEDAKTAMAAGQLGSVLAPWWKEILGPIASARTERGAPRFEPVSDDRIPSMMFVLTPELRHIGEEDEIRLCFADHPGFGAPYDPQFMAGFREKHAYTRFSHDGTTYYASSYSFCALVAGTAEAKNDFGRTTLQTHFRRHYYRMFFIVQMQKAALLAFSGWMAESSDDLAEYRKRILAVRECFIRFTHKAWFSNVSNQEQARDLFAFMQRHAGNPELYAEVREESEAGRDELQLAAEQADANNSYVLNILAMLATLLGLLPTLWSVLEQSGYMRGPLPQWLKALRKLAGNDSEVMGLMDCERLGDVLRHFVGDRCEYAATPKVWLFLVLFAGFSGCIPVVAYLARRQRRAGLPPVTLCGWSIDLPLRWALLLGAAITLLCALWWT
jgi:hypothetical protein